MRRAFHPALLLALLPLGLAVGLAQDPAETPTEKTQRGARVGAPAPTFTVNDHSGAGTSVGKSEGWTVLAFFPKAATPG